MHSIPVPTRLLPRQTRLIHAKEGLRFRVVAGHLWLTQPNVAQDLFLGPGDCVDLKQDWVVVGADGPVQGRGLAEGGYSAYELQPLVARASKSGGWSVLWVALTGLGGRLASGLRSAPPGVSAR